MTQVPISSLIFPRRLFAVHDKLAEYIQVYRKNRESEAQHGLANAKRQTLPISYTRRTPIPIFEMGSPESDRGLCDAFAMNHRLSYFANFWLNSRQVFQFAPELVDALRNTAVAEIPWGEINLPHSWFYLSLASAENPRFALNGVEYIFDGAFVKDATGSMLTGSKRALSLALVGKPVSEAIENMIARDDYASTTTFSLHVLSAGDDETVADALSNAQLKDAEQAEWLDQSMRKQVDTMARYDGPPRAPLTYHRRYHAQTAAVMESVLSLIVNSVFYLTQRPEDTIEGFPSDAPEALVKQVTEGTTHKKRREADKALARDGFSTIRFVSNPEVTAAANRNLAAPTGRKVAAHLRRGHWHRFAHGPGRTLRKWLFVAPIFVNADNGEIAHGGLYTVKPEPEREIGG